MHSKDPNLHLLHSQLLEKLLLCKQSASSQKEVQYLIEKMQEVMKDPNLANQDLIEDIMERINLWEREHSSISQEHKLFQWLQIEDFVKNHCPVKTFPKIYRSLPREIIEGVSVPQKEFQNIFHLKRLMLDKLLFSFYENVHIKSPKKILLFTWVTAKEKGSFFVHLLAKKLLQTFFFDYEIKTVAYLPKRFKNILIADEKTTLYYYEDKPSATHLENSETDILLQLPTYFPHTKELLQIIKHTKYEQIGEYGFIESKWFNPLAKAYSMGLHFLEKGIFIPEITAKKNEKTFRRFFHNKKEDFSSYLSNNHLFVGCVSSQRGLQVFLCAILTYLEDDHKDIDICVRDLSEILKKINFLKRFKIKLVEMHFDGKLVALPINPEGKKVCIRQIRNMSHKEFLFLYDKAQPFTVCESDQSFSEAISFDKLPFYDGKKHTLSFIKDWLALAQNLLKNNQYAVQFIRSSYEHMLGKERFEKTEEESFQKEKYPFFDLGVSIGKLLKNPSTIQGVQEVNQIIKREYNFNFVFRNIVKRAAYHMENPEVEDLEGQIMSDFLHDRISFSTWVQKTRELISKDFIRSGS